jgi:DNA adenine methylase
MKTPILYYGGKQQLAKTIVGIIPQHKVYVEPFIGGGAVFFSKPPSEVEVINDINGELVNFYKVIQNDFNALQKEIKKTLHSRQEHRHARVVYENPDMFSPVKRAWAVFVLANASFAGNFGSGFGYDKDGRTTKALASKIKRFTDVLSARIINTQIECIDALKIIKAFDSSETFFYLDPPYPETDQGHYDGYSGEDFAALLELLSQIQGKFLLSSFRHKALAEQTAKNNFSQFEITMPKPTSNNGGKRLQKIEVFTANYAIEKDGYGLLSLFD